MSDRIKTLYGQLVRNGYDLGGYEKFNAAMHDSNRRRSLYNQLVANRADLGGYEKFSSVVETAPRTAPSAPQKKSDFVADTINMLRTPSSQYTRPQPSKAAGTFEMPSKYDIYHNLPDAIKRHQTPTPLKPEAVMPSVPSNAAESVWAAADKAESADVREKVDEGWSWRKIMQALSSGASVTGGLGDDNAQALETTSVAHLKAHDLQKLSDQAWAALGTKQQQSIINDTYRYLKEQYPDADDKALVDAARKMARAKSDEQMYNLAVEKNMPKSVGEFFLRKAAAASSFGSLSKGYASMMAGTRGDMEAEDTALQKYGAKHKVADIAGSVAGFGVDPLTYASGAVGGAATKVALWTGGKVLSEAAIRKMSQTLGGKLLLGAVGGAANFGTFEAGGEALNQYKWGGTLDVDPETGRYVVGDFSVGKVASQMRHGLTMGGLTGAFGTWLGNVSTKAAQATSSTLGKLGVRTGELGVGLVGEGTIFATPEFISTYGEYNDVIKSVSDKNSPNYIADDKERSKYIAEIKAQRGERMMDIWQDNLAMIAGFKAQHALKSAGRTISELAASRRGKVGFVERMGRMLDGHPSLALSKEEQTELDKHGYGDLTQMVKEYKEFAQKDGDLPYNKITQLLNDKNVSEAARAKMYYYVTGHSLPMSAVIASNVIDNGDKTYTVQSLGDNGVITSRTYGSLKRADHEKARIDRQAELNGVAMAEQMFDNMDKAERLKAVCTRLAQDKGVSPETLLWLTRKDPKQMTAVEKRWIKEIEDAANEDAPQGENATVRHIKGVILDEYGVDVDKALRKAADSRTDAEETAISAYNNELAQAVAERKNAISQGETTDAYRRGYEADTQGMRDAYVAQMYEPSEDNAETLRGVESQITESAKYQAALERDELKQMTHKDGSIHLATLKDKDKDGNGKQVYIVDGDVVMKEDGSGVDADASSKSVIIYDPASGEKKMVSPTAVDGIESLGEVKTAEQREAEINARMQDTIQRGKDWLEGNVANPVGMQIQLGDGRIATIEAMHEDGKSAIATLPDGTQFMVPKDVLQRIVNNGQYADYKARRDAEASRRDAEQSTESAPETATEGGQPLPEEVASKEEERREYAQGDEFEVIVDGQKMHAEIVSPKDADGRFVVNVDDGESMRTLYVTPEELAAMEYREEPSPKAEETRLATEDSSEKALERGAQLTEEHAPTALERIPRDEKGNAQFHDVDTETAWDGLVEMSGNEETARKVAEASLANAEKRLKAAKALKEKGDTPEELLRSIKENEAVVAEAEKEVDAWKAIVGEKSRREEAAKAEAERIATEKAEAERKAAEERERAEAEEKARIEAEKKEAERIAAEKAEEEARVEDEKKAEEERKTKEGENTLKAKIEAASADVNTEPTEAQKEAGNYKKGHVQVGTFDITIEQPEGSIRRGTDADGKKWESKMHNTYGYFRGTEGVDGDHIDVFLSNDIDGWNGRKVFVVDQYNPDGTFDEHKVMLGFNDMDEAKSDYLANYEKGWENGRRITVSTTNLEDFEKWIDSSHRKTKPFSEYSSVNKETVANNPANDKDNGSQSADTHSDKQHPSADKGGEKPEKKQEKQSVFDKAKEIADKEEKKRKAEADKPKQKPLTEAERKDAEEVAGALGYRVEWVDTMAENGTIDADKKVIRIAKDAENPLVQVLGHEVAHGVKRMDGGKFRALQKAAMEVVGEKEWNERIEKKRKLNAYAEGKLAEEVTCDIVGEALNNNDALKRLAESLRGEKGILARLRDAVARMVEYFKNRGDKEGVRRMKAADKLLAEFESALKEGVAPEQVKPEGVDRSEREGKKDDKTLYGVHNISEDKLRKAMKLGGLANPSVAVIDISKNSHEGFGEISLILPSEKVAKRTGKNAGTWQGDAWTPTYPQIERRMSNKGAEKASKDVLSVPSDMYSEVRIGLDRWLDSGEANSAMAYMFLHEKGVAPEPKKIQPKFSDEAYNELKSITAGNFNIYGISKADAQKVLAMYIDAYFDGDKDLYEDKTKAWLEKNRSIVDAGDKGGMRYAIAKENVKLYDEYGFNYRGVQTFVRDVEYDHRNTGVDMNATLNEVEDYIKTNSLTDEFNTWQEGKEKEYGIKEVIFDGFTPSGNRRYIPNTLENVSKIMKKQGRNGATGAWASFPNFAARLMPSYGTLEDIRSKKGLLTSDREKIDDFREMWSKVFFELGMKCQPDATGTFDDYGFDRLSEAAMTSDPQAFLKQEYNVDFSDEDTKRLKKMVKAIKEEYPAMYFETKFERPVMLNEFAAAVVPKGIGDDVRKGLEDAGLVLYEYDPAKKGDRERAANEASASDGIRFNRSEKTELTEEERELRDNLVERMRKGGLDVVTDSEEMQRVIDTENERTRMMGAGSVREHRVYHGSGADFDVFDHSHMGEGEGAQAYGWGTYVTEVEGIGRTYAIQNSKYAREYPVYNGDSHGLSEGRINEILEVFLDGVSDETYILRAWDDAMQWYSSRKDDDYAQSLVRDASLLNPSDISIAGSKTRNLYTVEIPDDNGSNYLDWNGHPAESLLKDVGSFLESNGFERVQDSPVRYEKGESTVVLNPNATGADLYAELQEALGGDKKASQALAELGYTGIKYPADNMRGGRKDGAKNYVIFNENDAKITDHTRFLRTAGGEVYGLVKDGRIYLDPKVATAETAVHEYTHLWGDMLRRKDSEQWSHTVKELKNSVLWEEVKESYPELKTDDEIADEVLSTFSGRRGAERLREEARRVADGEGGVFTKAKAIETLERVKEAIARFWEGVARMFGINRYRSAEELADMAMRDLINGVKPTSRTFTFDNFYKDTKAVFEGTERPKGKPDYTSYSGSEYWYGEDKGGKYVVRGSDHWSGEFKVKDGERTNVGRNHYSEITEDGMLPIGAQGSLKFGWEKGLSKPVGSGISAAIDRRGSGDSNNIASCYWYIDNAKEKDNKGFTYGKAYLSEFEDKERRRDIPGDDWRDIQGLEGGTRAMRSDEIDRKYPDWLDGTTTDSGRHSTQVEGTRRTYNKVGDWIEKNIGKDAKILDASSGLGYGTADLKKRGFNIEDVEPYQSEERKKNNPATYSSYDDIPKDYDVIISNAVLNVIPDNWRSDVLHNMADHLKPGGIMFINTRKAGEERSIKDKIELDSPQEVLVKRNGKIASYQRFFAPKELKEWVEKELGNGYEVETANDNNSGTKGLAAVVVKKSDADIDRSVREFSPMELSNEDKQRRGDALRKAEPIDVKIKQIVKTKDMSARKAAEKWWKDNVGTSRFYDTEIGLVEINRASVGSSLAHRYSQAKLDAITSLVDGFNNAVYLGSMQDFSRQEGVKNHYFAYPINYNGYRNYVFCRAMQDANKNRLYVHEVFLADNIEKGNTLQTAAFQPHGGITLYKDILANVLTANIGNNSEPSKPRYSRKPGESIFDYASRVSEDVDRSVRERVSARDEYEKKVKSKGFQTKEALQNSMLGLQEFMYAIDHASGNKRYIEDIPDFENPILGENRLSSVNKEEMHQVAKTQFKPLMSAVAKLSGNGKESGELYDYMFAKHGLERDAVMRQREAQKEFDKYQKANPKGTKTIGDFVASLEGKDYAGLTALTAEDGRVKSIQSQIDAIDEQMKATDDQLLLRNLGGQKKRLKVDLLNAARDAADDIRKAFESNPSHDRSDINELWSRVNEVNGNTLRKLYESGMLTKEAYNDISSMYTNYIPMRGFDQTTSADAYAYLTHNDSAFNAPIKTAKGRSSKADNPIAYMQAMAESAIMQGNRNVLVKQKMLNFVRNHPSDLASVSDVWLQYDSVADEWKPVFPDNIGANDSASVVAKKMEAFEDKMKQMAENHPDLVKRSNEAPDIPYKVVEKGQLNEHQVLVRQNGKSYIITVNGSPRAAQAANGLTNPDTDLTGAVGKVFEGAEALNRQLSSLYTTLNPDFIGSNYVRDALYSNTMVYVKEGAKYGGSFNLNFAKYNPAEMANLYARYNKGSLDTSNETHRLFLEFMQNGGETGFVNLKQIEKRKSEIAKAIKREGKISAAQIWGGASDAIDFANRAVENSARFAAYVTSRRSGRSVGRSVYDAKEISVNFNRKGSGSKFMGAEGQTKAGNAAAFVSGAGRGLYIFWNAGLQGLTNFSRQIGRHPGRALTLASLLFGFGALMSYLGSNDDDDENNYFNLPKYIRRSNVCFKLGDLFVTIPLPVEYRAFYGLGELASSTLAGKESGTTKDITKEAVSQISQLFPIDFAEGGGGLHALIPSAVKPIVEAETNTAWTGLPIYKDNDFNKNMPEYTKVYKTANEHLVEIARALNDATGGNKYKKGFIDINPAKMEYVLKGMLGGAFSFPDKLVKTTETIMGDREFDWRNTPFANRFVKNADERTEYKALNEQYYKAKEEADIVRQQYNGAMKEIKAGNGSYKDLLGEVVRSDDFQKMVLFDAYNKPIKKLNDTLKQLRMSPDYDEKAEKVIREKIASVQRAMINKLEKMDSVNK